MCYALPQGANRPSPNPSIAPQLLRWCCQAPNMFVNSGSVCLFETELTGLYGVVSSSCPSPSMPSPPSPSLPSPPSPPLPSPSPPLALPPHRHIDLLVTTTVAAVAVKIAQKVFRRRRPEVPPPMPPPALPTFSHHCDNTCGGTTCEYLQTLSCGELTAAGCDCEGCCNSA